MQGVVEACIPPSCSGALVNNAFEQGWYASDVGENFCNLNNPGPNNVNINYTGYVVLQQTTLVDSSHITYLLSISNNNGISLYSQAMTDCPLPSGPPYPNPFTPVNFFTRLEGVVVGPNGGGSVTFQPLSSTIFSPFYLDMVSNYNSMSSYYVSPPCIFPCDTETQENSNLYQNAGQDYGTSYGSMYLWTVIGSEYTQTGM
jgi:hypothetical protein